MGSISLKVLKSKKKSKKTSKFFLVNIIVNFILLNFLTLKAEHDHLDHIDTTHRFSAVGTGPFFGLGESFLGTDLVVLQPAINTDLALLKENRTMAKNTGSKDGPSIPYVQMSGFTEVQTIFESNARNSVSLSAAQLTIDAWVNPWLTAFSNFGIELDETANNNFRMVTAFMTVGNLDKSPFYGTMGQIFVPFGSFSTGTSDMGTLTRAVGRIYQRALNIGFYPGNGFHVAAAFYNGQTRNSKTDNVDQYAGTVRYQGKGQILDIPASIDTGVSYTNNMADVAGMRSVFASGARLKRFVPAGDVFAKLNVGPFVFRGEYVSALRKFSGDDILIRNRRIRPSSYLGEAEYDTNIMGKDSWFVLHYSEVSQAAVMSRIHYQYGINVGVNLLKNTILSLEYSHRKTYSGRNVISNNSINVPGSTAIGPLNMTTVGALHAAMNGRQRNVLITTLDLFF